MYKPKSGIVMNVYIGVILFLLVAVNADPMRAFVNPLNNKAVDLFLVVDEGNLYVNTMELGLIKTALNTLVSELNPPGSGPYFGVFFYGATTADNIVVPFPTTSAAAVKANLDQKQYTMAQSNPSTLVSALNTVDSSCQTYCRSPVPRVVVVISSRPDSSAEATIRQLERNRGVTVIVIAMEFSESTAVLNRLASHPTRYYAVQVPTFFALVPTASYVASLVSDVPRLLDFNNPLLISSVANATYYTVQLNTSPYTTTNNTIVMFASSCPACAVYGSLSEPNPVSTNTNSNTIRHSFFAAGGYPNTMFYFRIPKNTNRFYLSLLGNGMPSTYILFNVFSLPDMMELSAINFEATDLIGQIG